MIWFQDEPSEMAMAEAACMLPMDANDLYYDCRSSASDEPLSDPEEEFERGLMNEDLDFTPNFGKSGIHLW